jgi:puromycin-sensitive aminopeptidase
MSMLAVDDLRPDWKVWSAFNRFRSSALEIDSLETTRAIEYPVHSPDDASGMFDTLTYIKGGAVLRMLEQYLGADRFRDGIRRYLRAHAYGNTDTHDLWDALEEQTGEPARRIMDAWIFQGGYPAISMRRDGKQVRFSQKQYLPSNPDAAGTWPVPLLVKQVHDGNERVDKVLVEVEGAAIPLVGPDAVVVANAGGTSFVRVWYDDELRTRLAPRIRELLTPDERYGLLDDAWSAVVVGETEAASFLDLIRGFDQENDLWVWQVMLTGLGWMDRFVEGSAREGLRDFIRDLVRPAFERLGWEPGPDEDHLTRSLRGQLVVALGTLGNDPEVRAQARELEGNHDIDPQLAAAAIEVVADVGNSEDYERFVRRMKDAPNPQEEQRYQEALARFRDDSIMDRVLASTLGDDIRTQDAPFLLARATMNRDQGSRAWSFIKQHWNDINSRFAGSNIISVVSGTRFLTEPAVVADVQAFFTEHDIPQNHLMLLQTLERQRVAAAMRERLAPELEARFSRQA